MRETITCRPRLRGGCHLACLVSRLAPTALAVSVVRGILRWTVPSSPDLARIGALTQFPFPSGAEVEASSYYEMPYGVLRAKLVLPGPARTVVRSSGLSGLTVQPGLGGPASDAEHSWWQPGSLQEPASAS